MDSFAKLVTEWQQWIFVPVVVVCALIIGRLLHWLIGRLVKRLQPAERPWLHSALSALDAPLRAMVWLLGLVIVVRHFSPTGNIVLIDRIFPATLKILVTVIISWFLVRMIVRVQHDYLARGDGGDNTIDATAVDGIGKLCWVAVIIFALLTILQTLGVSVAGLLAFGGAAGVALGFAAQTLVANLLGGMTVYASRIFRIGEDIILTSAGISGTVQQIGWRATRVRGWDGKLHFVPNALFNTKSVTNHSRLTWREMSESVLLRYRDFDKVEAIIREGNAMLAKRADLGYFVFRFAHFGDGALRLSVYAYVQTNPPGTFLPYAEFCRIREDILLAIAAIARAQGCELILPASNLYLREGRYLPLPAPSDDDAPGGGPRISGPTETDTTGVDADDSPA